jgi:hypothetical protein
MKMRKSKVEENFMYNSIWNAKKKVPHFSIIEIIKLNLMSLNFHFTRDGKKIKETFENYCVDKMCIEC